MLNVLFDVDCLEDTCCRCMPIHAKEAQDHDDMKASRCPIEEPDN